MTRAATRGFLASVLFGIGTISLIGCPPADPPDDGPKDECSVPRDCGAGYDCIEQDDGLMACIKLFCTTDSDCDSAAGEHCDRRRGLCLGDICRTGVSGACPAGKVCLGGVCTDPPPPADNCEILPGAAVVRAGSTATLEVTGSMSSGALAPMAVFTWAADPPTGCVTVDDSGVATGDAAASSVCTATVTATPAGGGTPCTATVTNFPSVAAPALRAVVMDELTGELIDGAQVLVRTDDGSGGAVTELPTVTTVDGVASFADIGVPVSNILDVSVFHQAYAYLTVVRPRGNDLQFTVREVPDANRMAGVKSVSQNGFDFSHVHTQGDIKLGIAGLSFPGSLTDLDFMMLLGEEVARDIDLEGVGSFDDVPLPSGIYLELAAASVKGDFQAFGVPGKRILWGLGGRVRLADIGPIISEVAGGEGELDVGGILRAVLPYFGTFDHAIAPNLDLVEVTRPSEETEPNTWDFGTPDQQLVIDTLLSQSATYDIPTLPHVPGRDEYITGAIVLLGAVVSGQGTVPLGLTAGLDAPEDTDPADGILDPIPCPENDQGCIQPGKGEVIVDFAPPHSGMEGSPYITLAMALGLDSIGTALSTSVVIDIQESVGETNTFESGSFLDFPQGASYIQGVSYQQSSPLPGASFHRLNLDVDDREWQVYFDDAVSGVTLPTPPGGMESRVDEADIQSFKAFGGAFSVTDLFTFNDVGVGDLLWLTSSFSSLECVRVERPQAGNCDSDDEYTLDEATGLCVGGPDNITAFAAGTAGPCSNQDGYEPVYVDAEGSAGICAKTPSCRKES